jgi:hypothetical protein
MICDYCYKEMKLRNNIWKCSCGNVFDPIEEMEKQRRYLNQIKNSNATGGKLISKGNADKEKIWEK